MTRTPDSSTRPWWRRGSTMLAAAVGATVLTPVLVSDRPADSCRAEVRDVRYHGRSSQVYTYACEHSAAESATPRGVLVHLHGDGAGEFDTTATDPTLGELAQVAASRDMVLVAPRTPDRHRGQTWWRALDRNVTWLTALVTDLLAEGHAGGRPLDDGDVWWSGYSGGAEMLSYGILRSAPDLVSGGAVMMAGGGAPDEFPVGAAGALTAPVRWSVGDRDDGTRSSDGFDALGAARDGSVWYRRHSAANVELEVLPGVAHLDFPQSTTVDRMLGDARQ
ncbi:hypothetical protein PQI66_14060 [Corynebacterium sp. USCH3]|uniref:hypothetical protein n=1 Tax=Corynebacterium sp. USCH3 TaxID=3024840 RepID=UPI00309D7AE0